MNHIDDRFDHIEKRLNTAVTQRSFTNFWLFVIVAILLFGVLGCTSTPYAPPPCSGAADPELCEMERRLDRIEYQRMRERQCHRTHGSDSIVCGGYL